MSLVDWLLMLGAIAVAFAGAWLVVRLFPGHPPDPPDDEPHTYELVAHADGNVTCEAWCPSCHAWIRVRYNVRHYFPSCEHTHDALTTRGWRELKRHEREWRGGEGLVLFNFTDRICYGAPVRGSTEKRTRP